MFEWTKGDIPDQTGRVAVVTGANTGLGLETARELARKGATVVVAARNLEKGRAAIAEIEATVAGADVHLHQLDLSSLERVRESAQALRDGWERIYLLFNNAGVMITPFELTPDGYELQFATNHLGHYAFTGLILDRLLATPGSRIVTTSSLGHRAFPAQISNEAIGSKKGFNTGKAYARSKLANLLYSYALQRRLTATGADTIALAAHPGMSATELARHIPRFLLQVVNAMEPMFIQPAAKGALPQLRAGTDPTAKGGQYYGPNGIRETTGPPMLVGSSKTSHNNGLQDRLWSLSEEITGVRYDL